ncbi:uracil-DNA glycosylase [Thermococcus sp. MV5]|uniref:uracil-DNA glycosylase family protein n=1 Tax=Thermococcus sp. MV5 TaxID=1638272 RepID=UPI00143B39E9|nr:uracil-DNA glycosylase family protein [Thermococcus sp. MV5]NJE26726.1 uracil-DNA glycosylase [Thermococcus sp. MV5]
MLLRLEVLKKVGELYLNPNNFRVMPLTLQNWRDFLSLSERIYGIYARTIYNPKERFLVKTRKDEKIVDELTRLYWTFMEMPSRFCHEEYYEHQLKIKAFDGLPFANGWVGSGIVLVGEAPGKRGCGFTGICFYRDASGMLLRKTLFSLGINPDFVYLTNVVKCNPVGNKLKGFEERELSILARELEIIKPKKVFAIGRTAYRALNKLGFEGIYLKHPAWYVRRGIREPNEKILEEYAQIKEVFEWIS